MKKKIVALLLALVMVVGLIPAAVYAAESEPKVTLEVVADKATAVPGDEITYTVTLKTEYALTSMAFTTSFPAGLVYVDGSGSVDAGAKSALNSDDIAWVEWTNRVSMGANEGENKFQSIASTPNTVTDLVLCTFKAKVTDDAATDAAYAVEFIGLDEFMDGEWEMIDEADVEVIVSAVNVVDHVCADNLEEVKANDPTCTEDGNKAYYECNECGVKYLDADATELAGDVIIPATGHDNGEWATVTDATCTEAGSENLVCGVCDEVLDKREIAALGHTEGEAKEENRVEATCTEDGSFDTVVYCTVCDAELSRETTTIDALGHTEGDVEYENVSDATCTEGGSGDAVIYCTVCDVELSRVTTEVPALGHTEGEWVVAVEATCTETGVEELHCAVCDEVIDEAEIEALGHTDGEWVVATAPTCTEVGVEELHCAVCDEVIDEAEIDALGHDYASVVTDPTCTEAGYTTYTCTVCGDEYVADEVAALGHTEGEAKEEKRVEATCTADGSYDTVVYCTVCDAELSRETTTIDALGHTEGEAKEENRVEATCTVDGSYDTVVYCTVCGAEVSREASVITAPGHDYAAVVTDPTCVDAGFTTYTCTVCGDSYVADEVAALGHTDGEWVEDATERGKWNLLCAVCDAIIDSEIRLVPVEGIELDQTEVTTKYVRKAPAFTLTATVSPVDAEKLPYTVVWSSSNEKVATVDEDGNVTTHHFGDAVITATLLDADGNVVDTATCEVNVYYTFCQWLIWFFLLGCAWYFV